jgi:hypothetical protein
LTLLFSLKEPLVDNYNNLLFASNLEVEDIDRAGGTLHIYLHGALNIYGPENYCSDWQARDQIVKTVEQFMDLLAGNGIFDIIYHMDEELLDDLLLHDMVMNSSP